MGTVRAWVIYFTKVAKLFIRSLLASQTRPPRSGTTVFRFGTVFCGMLLRCAEDRRPDTLPRRPCNLLLRSLDAWNQYSRTMATMRRDELPNYLGSQATQGSREENSAEPALFRFHLALSLGPWVGDAVFRCF